ncbi:MAG: hypothetical protein ABJA85_02810 [Bacteroidota bacterium]
MKSPELHPGLVIHNYSFETVKLTNNMLKHSQQATYPHLFGMMFGLT